MEHSPSFVGPVDQLKAQALRELATFMRKLAERFPVAEPFRSELEDTAGDCQLRAALIWPETG